MKLPTFKLEEYFSQWEFKAPYLLCMSDTESWSLNELLSFADTESLTRWEKLSLGYTETRGLPSLREEISHLYMNAIATENILTFAGAEEGIYASLQTLLSPQDHVIVFTPCYQSLEAIPRHLGARVTAIPLNEQKGWMIDLEEVKQAFKPSTKLVILNFPHNPTGALLDFKTFKELVNLARQYQAYIFSDEVYRYLEFDSTKRLPAIADYYEKGISLSVLSKAFGLPGLRIGWIATQDKQILHKIAEFKHYLSICNSAPSEVLALIGLRAKDQLLKRNHSIIQSNLSILYQFFKTYSDILSWHPPIASCIAFPKLLIQQNSQLFAEALVQEEGVLILPGNVYNWTSSYFRIGFGRRSMPHALERLEAFILKHYR